jgi:F0F1-type ATP synthase assembly protein I
MSMTPEDDLKEEVGQSVTLVGVLVAVILVGLLIGLLI